MKKVSYIGLILLLLVIFVAIFGFINQNKLIDRFVSRQSDAAAYRYDLLEEDDKIRLVTVGTGSPLPGNRVRSCNAVIINGHFFLFDVGPGSSLALENLRLPIDKLKAIFITHWHADHYMDLPELVNRSWLLNRQDSLFVHGPEGIDTVMSGLNMFIEPDNRFRLAHHGTEVVSPSTAYPIPVPIDTDDDGYAVVYEQDGILIEAFLVNHEPVSPSLGYRVSFNGKSLVFSGDTRQSDTVIKYAQGADILVHEALASDFLERAIKIQTENGNERNAAILKDLMSYHSTPVDAATVAEKAGVKRLILSHLGPAPENPISRRMFTSNMDDIYQGPILLAEDGDLFVIE